MGLFDFLRSGTKPPPASREAKVIELLELHGSDTGKPREIEFFFYLSDEVAAENLALVLQQDGFEASVSGPAEDFPDDRYCVLAVKSLVPALTTLERLTARLEDLAKAYGGEFDGWGTGIVE